MHFFTKHKRIYIGIACSIFLLIAGYIGIGISIIYNANYLNAYVGKKLSATIKCKNFKSKFVHGNIHIEVDNLTVQRRSAYSLNIKHIQADIDVLQTLLHMSLHTKNLVLDDINIIIPLHHDERHALLQTKLSLLKNVLGYLKNQNHVVAKKINLSLIAPSQINVQPLFLQKLSWYKAEENSFNLIAYENPNTQKNNFLIKFSIPNTRKLQGTGYIKIQNKMIAGLLGIWLENNQKSHSLTNYKGYVQFWLNWKPKDDFSAHGNIVLDSMNVIDKAHQQNTSLKNIYTTLVWHQNKNHLMLSLSPMQQYPTNTGTLIINNFTKANKATLKIHARNFHIDALQKIFHLFVNKPKDTYLWHSNKLKLRGMLNFLDLQLTRKHNAIKELLVNIEFNGLHITHGDDLILHNLSGKLKMNSDTGSLQLDSPGLDIKIKHLLPLGAHNLGLKTVMSWHIKQNILSANLKTGKLHNPQVDLDATGTLKLINFNIDQLLKGHVKTMQPYLTANIKFQGHKVTKLVNGNIPDFINPGLRKWLQYALLDIPEVTGEIHLDGNIQKLFSTNKGSIADVMLHLNNASFSPWYGWPAGKNVNVDLKFHGINFLAKVNHAESPGINVATSSISVADIRKGIPSDLVVTATATATFPIAAQYLLDSPIKTLIAPVFAQISLDGTVTSSLNFSFPLARKTTKNSIKAQLTFNENTVTVKNIKLDLDNLSGQILLDGQEIHGKNLQVLLWKQLLKLELYSKFIKHKNIYDVMRTLNVTGNINTTLLSQHTTLPILKKLQGLSKFKLSIVSRHNDFLMKFYSSLYGTTINLPPPFYKDKSTQEPLTLLVQSLNKTDSSLAIKLGNELSVSAILHKQHNVTEITKGVVELFSKDQVFLPRNNEIDVIGALPYVDAQSWIKILTQSPSNVNDPHNVSLHFLLPHISLQHLVIKRLQFMQQTWHNTNVSMDINDTGWKLLLKGPQISGSLSKLCPKQSVCTFLGNFEYLHLHPFNRKINFSTGTKALNTFANINIHINKLYYATQPIGKLLLKGRLYNGLTTVIHAKLKNKNETVVLRTNWTTDQDAKHQGNTVMQISVHSKNWMKTLHKIGYNKELVSGTGNINLTLRWPGEIICPDLSTIYGHIKLNIHNGVIPKLEPGFGRILGMMSIESLMDHLRFNFSDVTDKGLKFNSIQATYKIKNGIATTKDFSIIAPSLSIFMKGVINIVTKQIKGKIVLVPNISSGVAIASTIIAGPIVGAAAWVVDHIFSHTILKNHASTYSISGSINSPKLQHVK